jgi:hypothetical protein
MTNVAGTGTTSGVSDHGPLLLGLRTTIYPAPDLAAAKAWMSALLGVEPYFDTDFYVGYTVAGYELALDPHADPARGVITYWGVADADDAHQRLLDAGATANGPVEDVGDAIRCATFTLPHSGAVFGIIENPHFRLFDGQAETSAPGR